MKTLQYHGYTSPIKNSQEDQLFYGKIPGIKRLISYEGATGPELEADFKAAIEDYLEDCKSLSLKPEKPFKGRFNVRIPSELHKEAALKAQELNTSLNNFVSESIRARLLSKI